MNSYILGDDGDTGAGIALPDPRFTINPDSTLTDNLTGLSWAQGGGTPNYGPCIGGVKTWQGALNYIACLNSKTYSGHNDWRLPNRKEIRSLIEYGQENAALWLNAQGFFNVDPGEYWSSTTYAPSSNTAWVVNMASGKMSGNNKETQGQVWPVRVGTTHPITDTTPPSTTVSPAGGTYSFPRSVVLTCNDGTGSGCHKIYYTIDGTTPSTSSPVYESPIVVSMTTTLKFFAKDLAGNAEGIKSQTYIITTGTSTVTVWLKDSNGNPLTGGVVQYYSGGWKTFGTTDANGRVSKLLAVGSYSFSMTYAYGRQVKSQNINAYPVVVFQTGKVHSDSGRCTNYYAGGWRGFIQNMELLPAAYTFRFNDRMSDRSYIITAGIENHIH